MTDALTDGMSRPRQSNPWRARLAPGLLAIAMAGCATQREGVPDPLARFALVSGLKAGQLRLNCDHACAVSWQMARTALRGLDGNDLWTDLATEVARIGYSSDLGYFYLGRAAEGLGEGGAAAVYYRLALAHPRKCDGLIFDSCDGNDVPSQARAALARLPGTTVSGSLPRP